MSSLPRNVALQVLGMSTPRDDLGPDSLVWGLESNGRFSVRSAYQLLNDFSVEASGSNWDYIWRWKGPTQLIAWRPGDEGWSTLNTDGSRICHTGATSIGGLIRDEKGGFLRAFCANIGTCSITRAEIKAIVEGLKIAWHIGIRKIAIQSDSKAAVTILQNSEVSTSPHRALIAEFHELRSRDWVVSLSHIFREANCAADHLANFGHSFEFGMYLFDVPDSSLAHWLRYDLIGVALPRAFYSNQ
ncbi:Putative ribonuclease H protein At1g65750 [Linum perenne]